VVLTAGKAAPAPRARAVYLAARGALIFQASNLGPLPEHKAYELWVIPANGKAPIPAGLFWPDAAGSANLVLPKLPVGVPAKAFGVTIENAEGSPWPTTPIILAGVAPTS
jgi:anti-sigma-K factor RskA